MLSTSANLLDLTREARRIFKFRSDPSRANIVNPAFACFSSLTFYLFMVMGFISLLPFMMDEQIKCIVPRNDIGEETLRRSAVEKYCLVLGPYTAHFNESGQKVAYTGVPPAVTLDDPIQYARYYQWVPAYFFVIAFLFVGPYKYWKMCEGGRIGHFCAWELVPKVKMRGQGFIPDRLEAEKSERIKIAAAAFKEISQHGGNHLWAYQYMIAEVLNPLMVVFVVLLSDRFLSLGNSRLSEPFTRLGGEYLGLGNPSRSTLFPKMVKCDFRVYGPSGSIIPYDILCVLPVNLLNERLFLIAWFWLAFLFILGTISILYRALFVCSKSARLLRVSLTPIRVTRSFRALTKRLHSYPDWFFLWRIGQNFDGFRFQEFCQALYDLYEREDGAIPLKLIREPPSPEYKGPLYSPANPNDEDAL